MPSDPTKFYFLSQTSNGIGKLERMEEGRMSLSFVIVEKALQPKTNAAAAATTAPRPPPEKFLHTSLAMTDGGTRQKKKVHFFARRRHVRKSSRSKRK